MAIVKCKMCGGDITIQADTASATCEYCGSLSTLPHASSEQTLNLHNRANHLRMLKDFDKAQNIYESIITQNPCDAEAYWGIVLCRYGIEYVEDEATHHRIPTLNRMQYRSVLEDEGYLNALENADVVAKSLYEKQAQEINRIQAGFLSISSKEPPFDVFICYKESDGSSQRTPDSVYAQEIYQALIDEGYKVFFSKITLEKRLGEAYEPYIFAALNSAKVMLVVGTRAEYMQAKWVRNEWSRFLYLMNTDRSKRLIPVYRDMDAYELPEEFAYLQAQDYSKVGAMQDLLRGIKKIMTGTEDSVPKQNSRAQDDQALALLRRGHIYLEDGEFGDAIKYFDRALDFQPDNAQAYMYKLCAEMGCRTEEELCYIDERFDTDKDYARALRFASSEEKIRFEYLLEEWERWHVYWEAIRRCTFRAIQTPEAGLDYLKQAIETQTTAPYLPGIYLRTAEDFQMLGNYKDAPNCYALCMKLAKIAKEEAIFAKANSLFSSATNLDNLLQAQQLYKSIPNYAKASVSLAECEKAYEERLNQLFESAATQLDSAKSAYQFQHALNAFEKIRHYKAVEDYISLCQRRLKECEAEEEAKETAAALARIRLAKRQKRSERLVWGFIVLILIATGCIAYYQLVVIPANHYKSGEALAADYYRLAGTYFPQSENMDRNQANCPFKLLSYRC